jgi:glycosyltransferase involved in cell wall biosynthesis
MRILYIHQYFATKRGRTGTRSLEQALAMKASGYDVTMLTSSAQLRDDEIPCGKGIIRRGSVAGIPAIVLHIRYDQQMGYLSRICAFLKFMFLACWIVLTMPRVDLVYASSTPLTIGVPAMAGKLLRSIPYFFEVRDLWPDIPVALGVVPSGLPAALLRSAELAIYRHARTVVPLNPDMAREINKKTHNRKKLVIVPNACDIDVFSPELRDGELRHAYGLDDKIICIHAGALGKVNYLDDVLDAAELLKDDPRLSFVLIGEGNQKARLKADAEARGLSNVLFLDAISKSRLSGLLADCDIGLMTVAHVPELQWNCANKLCDYLASGLPIVLNYGGWHGALVADYQCGLSARQGDITAFAEAIRRLADEPELRGRFSLAARGVAETEMNRQTLVARLMTELEQFQETLEESQN